ncbi:MAG TPA: tetratricopeptide repeat protein [Polyangia bacterium]|jgi:hypothetical protein
MALGVAVLLAAAPAHADDSASIDQLNKQALEAFDGLNFDQAKTLLEKALTDGEASGLDHDPAIARTHLDLGMLLIAGFQRRDDAIDHFKTALTIAPDISAPAGLFNPEVQAAFDDAKQQVETEKEAERKLTQQRRAPRPAAVVRPKPKKAEEEEDDSEGGSGFFLSLGVGSGAGIAKGKLDTNTDVAQNGTGDNAWSGGLAASRLGHITLGVGYFLSKDLLLSLEGRLQIISGTTPVTGTDKCPSSCSPPSTAFAVMAKATYFLTSGPLRPFVSGGIGAGNIREVVKLTVTPAATDPNPVTHCGSSGNDPTCVDTVTGGPLLFAAGGGLAYQLGSVDLLGGLTANIGVPNFMLNVDLTLGVGLRL